MAAPRTAQPPSTPSLATQPKTTLAQVQQAYPTERADLAALEVPGMELFALYTEREVPQDSENHPRIVAIVGGLGSPILEKRDVTIAASKATKDPVLLAKVVMAVEEQGGELLLAPETDEHRKAKVGRPAIAGSTLTFWVWTSGVGRMLRFAKVDLATGSFDFTAPPVSTHDRIAQAAEALAGTSLSMHARALETLSAACASDSRARSALLDTLSRHNREETRAAAADIAAVCGAAAIDMLIQAMEKDASSTVRWKAAKGLGDIGDAKAKPALEKAAKSSDRNVQSAASRALEKLK